MRRPYYLRARKAWYLDVTLPNGKHSQIRLADKRSDAFDLWKSMLRREQRSAAGDPLFCELADSWLEWIESRVKIGKLSSDYLTRAGGNMVRFVKAHPSLPACDLTADLALKWASGQGWANDTIATAIGNLRTCLRWAASTKRIADGSALDGCEIPRRNRREVIANRTIYLTMFADCRFMPHRNQKRFALFLLILWRTGCRPGELRALTIEQVDFERGLWIQAKHKSASKTGRPRVVYLDPCTLTAIRMLSAGRKSGPVFTGMRNKPLSRTSLRLRMKRLSERCNCPGVVAYSFRHGFATEALAANVSVPVVAQLMGHSSSSMVERVYGHIDQRADAIRREMGEMHR